MGLRRERRPSLNPPADARGRPHGGVRGRRGTHHGHVCEGSGGGGDAGNESITDRVVRKRGTSSGD